MSPSRKTSLLLAFATGCLLCFLGACISRPTYPLGEQAKGERSAGSSDAATPSPDARPTENSAQEP